MNSNNCIVCFLDILGYGDIVYNRTLEEIYEAFKKILSTKSKIDNPFNEKSSHISKNINMQILSDSIIFVVDLDSLEYFDETYDVQKKQSTMAGYFPYLVAMLWMESIRNLKCLFRGGISRGQYFQKSLDHEKNQLLFSKALVQANKLEKNASVPRILVDDNLCEYILGINDSPILREMIQRDDDGLYFLDIYSVFKRLPPTVIKGFLEDVVDILRFQIKKNRNNPKILMKYAWFVNRHNFYVNQLSSMDKFSDVNKYLIDFLPRYLSNN